MKIQHCPATGSGLVDLIESKHGNDRAMSYDKPTTVTVVTPTMNRPEPLRRALLSLIAQELPDDIAMDVVVVDNSSDSNARGIVGDVAAQAPFSIHYIPEPRPGVATARNAGVAAAGGDFIAFLDDDEEASSGWLAAMVSCARRSGAAACFGPIEARAEEGAEIGPFAAYFSRGWSMPDVTDITNRAAYLGTNNAMLARGALAAINGPFDESLNRSGGEDSLLLQQIVSRGGRLAWCSQGDVIEWVPGRRLNWAYVKRRKFLSGQIRTFVLGMLDPPRHVAMLFWMAAGTVQLTVYGVAAFILRLGGSQRAARFSATAWGGLGKVLWMKRFRPGLYGEGLVS
jgi:succinoglycan biosynthesis protein ExoM